MIKNLYRGDIVYISLPQQRGSIQAGFRPCVVVSNNKSNKYSNHFCRLSQIYFHLEKPFVFSKIHFQTVHSKYHLEYLLAE